MVLTSLGEQVAGPTQYEVQPFQRLLRGIACEFTRLTEENAQLQKEIAELQELLGCGLGQAYAFKGEFRGGHHGEMMEGASSTATTSARAGTARSAWTRLPQIRPCSTRAQASRAAPQPPRPCGESHELLKDNAEAAVGTWPLKAAAIGKPLQDGADDREGHAAARSAASTVDFREVANGDLQVDVIDNAMEYDAEEIQEVRDLRDSRAAPGNEFLWDGRSRTRTTIEYDSEIASVPDCYHEQLRDQFTRLDTASKGYLNTEECFAVVQHWEHQLYGHVKHSLKRVARTIQAINAKYLDQPTSSSLEQAWEGLEFEPFHRFMTNDKPDEGEGYFKKAFVGEATEYLTALARENIAEKYKEERDPEPTGCLRIVIETAPPVVILTNALALGLQADIETDATFWEVMEVCFFNFYLVEFILKVRLLGCYKYFRGHDGAWNIFDLFCLILSMFDLAFLVLRYIIGADQIIGSGLVNIIKVLRLARLARIVRSFRYKLFDDLKIMVLGVLSGARVLFWAIVLFFMCIYIVGVFMKEMVGNTNVEFGSVPSAMFSVFRCFTDGCSAYDGTPLSERLRQSYGSIFMVFYILMFLIVTVGVFNLIMAIFIDNVVTTNMKRKQHELGMREEEMRIAIEEMLVSLIRNVTPTRHLSMKPVALKKVETTAELKERKKSSAMNMAQVRAEHVVISRDLFNTWLTDPDLLSLLDEVNVDTATKAEIFDVCDVDKSGTLTPDELVGGLMRLRGPISKCDVIAIRLKVRYLTNLLEDVHSRLGA